MMDGSNFPYWILPRKAFLSSRVAVPCKVERQLSALGFAEVGDRGWLDFECCVRGLVVARLRRASDLCVAQWILSPSSEWTSQANCDMRARHRHGGKGGLPFLVSGSTMTIEVGGFSSLCRTYENQQKGGVQSTPYLLMIHRNFL